MNRMSRRSDDCARLERASASQSPAKGGRELTHVV